jgi:hypothetical protein
MPLSVILMQLKSESGEIYAPCPKCVPDNSEHFYPMTRQQGQAALPLLSGR